MPQSRVCSYYNFTCKHGPLGPASFLTLPEDVRFQVYRYVLVAGSTLFFENEYGNSNFFSEDSDPMDSYRNLRLVNTIISMDALRYLCLNNDVTFTSSGMDYTMETFLEVPTNMLHWLRRVTIILWIPETHTARCHSACVSCPQDPDNPLCRRLRSEMDCNELKSLEHILDTWTELIDDFALSPNISKMDLSLWCDVDDAMTAWFLLKPFVRLRVAKCRIRPGRSPNHVLRMIARQVVLHVSDTQPQESFRFSDLPVEIRRHILSFTDLITPDRELQWSPSFKFYLQDWLKPYLRLLAHNEFCCSAYAMYPACSCWAPPTPLFLVCQSMLVEARAIFFRSNRFVITTEYEDDQPPIFREEPFEASIFLTQVVPQDSLNCLRDLEILFPPIYYSALGVDPAVLADWECAIELAAPHLNRLTLQLYMGVENTCFRRFHDVDDEEAAFRALMQVHNAIVRPLRHLRHLNDFFVMAASPAWAIDSDHTAKERTVYLQEHQKNLETFVMGSAYDSKARGKLNRAKSMWLMDLLCLL